MLDRENKKMHEEFLKAFTYAGEYCYSDGNTLEFKKSEELGTRHRKGTISGYYAICVDGEIKYIGESKADIYSKLNTFYKTGGSKSKKSLDNKTYKRVNKNIKMICKYKRVTTYFIDLMECEFTMDNNYKSRFVTKFGKEPDWAGSTIKTKELTKSDKKIFRETIKNDREQEVKEQLELINTSPQVKRDYQEKIRVLEKSGDKCALDGFQGQKCVTFEKRNVLPGSSNKNYLEAHHLIPLFILKNIAKINLNDFDYSNLDTAENMVCLCSNCHNKIHYGKYEEVELMVESLYEQKIQDLKSKNLNIDIGNLLEMYQFELGYDTSKRK